MHREPENRFSRASSHSDRSSDPADKPADENVQSPNGQCGRKIRYRLCPVSVSHILIDLLSCSSGLCDVKEGTRLNRIQDWIGNCSASKKESSWRCIKRAGTAWLSSTVSVMVAMNDGSLFHLLRFYEWLKSLISCRIWETDHGAMRHTSVNETRAAFNRRLHVCIVWNKKSRKMVRRSVNVRSDKFGLMCMPWELRWHLQKLNHTALVLASSSTFNNF